MSKDQENIGEGPTPTQKREQNITELDLEILEYLRLYGRTRKADIIKALNLRKSTADHHLNKLEDYRRVHRIEHDQIEKKTIYYDLTPTELGKEKPRTSEINVFNISPKEKHEVREKYDLTPEQVGAVLQWKIKIRMLKRSHWIDRIKGKQMEETLQDFLSLKRK